MIKSLSALASGNERSVEHQDLQMIGLKLNKINMSNFYPLKVVGRGSETQLQVAENLNYFI